MIGSGVVQAQLNDGFEMAFDCYHLQETAVTEFFIRCPALAANFDAERAAFIEFVLEDLPFVQAEACTQLAQILTIHTLEAQGAEGISSVAGLGVAHDAYRQFSQILGADE